MVDIKIGYSKALRNRSPVLDVVDDEITTLQRRSNGFSLKVFEEEERASTSTIRRWRNGQTRRPQFDKVLGVLDLLDMEIIIRKRR